MDPQRYLLRIVSIENFKSVKNRIVLTIPSKCMIGVIGANGAGKSVCLEAIAFASGSSIKDLRVNKLEELVQFGTVPTVELEFKNGASRSLKVACTIVDGNKRCGHE